MCRCGPFREALQTCNECFLLAVPSNALVRDAEAVPPKYSVRGRHPQLPWQHVDRWCAAQPESAWTTRDGEKGPLLIDVKMCGVQARTSTGGTSPEEVLFFTGERLSEGAFKYDYCHSNAAANTALQEFAHVAKAEHRIEECFHRGKSETGLGDYQVRNWLGGIPPNPLTDRRVVPQRGGAAGKNQIPAVTVPQARRDPRGRDHAGQPRGFGHGHRYAGCH